MAEEETVSKIFESIALMLIMFSMCIVSHQVTNTKSVEKPPFPRNETGLCGLKNQGATW